MNTQEKMFMIKPAYYDKFECIAGACPYTCCQQWKIAVDEETRKKWEKTPCPGETRGSGNLSSHLTMKDGQRVIRLKKDGFCPFLSEEKLCRLVTCFGPSALSETCSIFPREIHTFPDRKEAYLMPCCPVTLDYLEEAPFAWADDESLTILEEKDFLAKVRGLWVRIAGSSRDASDALGQIFLTALGLLDQGEAAFPTPDQLDEAARQIRQLPESVPDTFAESNELFLDLAGNYLEQGIYSSILEPACRMAEEMEEAEEDELFMSLRSFSAEWKKHTDLMRNLLAEEIAADTLLPDCDLRDMVIKVEWIAMEYAAIRHLSFLQYADSGHLTRESLKENIVTISRMMGYDDDDIHEYLEEGFEDEIWPWGYLNLLTGHYSG